MLSVEQAPRVCCCGVRSRCRLNCHWSISCHPTFCRVTRSVHGTPCSARCASRSTRSRHDPRHRGVRGASLARSPAHVAGMGQHGEPSGAGFVATRSVARRARHEARLSTARAARRVAEGGDRRRGDRRLAGIRQRGAGAGRVRQRATRRAAVGLPVDELRARPVAHVGRAAPAVPARCQARSERTARTRPGARTGQVHTAEDQVPVDPGPAERRSDRPDAALGRREWIGRSE